MLDRALCKVKSARKQTTLKGVSVVHLITKHDKLQKLIKELYKQLGSYANYFNWTEQSGLHVTVIRCRSVKTLPMTAEEFCESLMTKVCGFYPYSLNAKSLSLTNDGVIRLQCDEVATCCKRINNAESFSISSVEFMPIHSPWITLAYIDDAFIKDAIANEDIIRKTIESFDVCIKVLIDTLEIVAYNDTAFREYRTIYSWRLNADEG